MASVPPALLQSFHSLALPTSLLRATPRDPKAMNMLKKLVAALRSGGTSKAIADKPWTRCGTLLMYAGTLCLRAEFLAEINAKKTPAETRAPIVSRENLDMRKEPPPSGSRATH